MDDAGTGRTAHASRWLVAGPPILALLILVVVEIGKLDRGEWIDPAGGKQLFGEYAPSWLAGRVKANEKTREWYEGILRSRVLPMFEH